MSRADKTAQLPDEVLCHVFSFLSLKDKLQSEAVNRKFQRCIIKELTIPQSLELDFVEETLNGYSVAQSQNRIFGALRALAKKARFNRVDISIDLRCTIPKRVDKMDRVLSLLISENQCLSKVSGFKSNSGCSQAVLENFLDNCGKLSALKFDFDIKPLMNSDNSAFPLDLCQLLKNRRLVELELSLFRYPQERLTQMFESIKLNTLRKVGLRFLSMPVLNSVELVKVLSHSASALEEICLSFMAGHHVQLAHLFEALARLPALRKCDIQCSLLMPNNDQFVAAVTSLFNLNHINITVKADGFCFFIRLPGCQMVNMIHQIQNVHPGLAVDFDYRGTLTLSLGNASIRKLFFDFGELEHCGAEDCVQCQSFYPSLLQFLRLRATDAALDFADAYQHFPNWQLDRCRVGEIVEHLNANFADPQVWSALSAELNEDQQIVSINFVALVMQHQEFGITVSCGRCLSNGCIVCVN